MLSNEQAPIFLKPELHFKWPEYIVFGLVLVASLGIGIFYGFFDKKNKTNEEFLMAGRSMSILPVTMSLICSFISAITLLGNPVEVYFYGAQYAMIAFALIPMTLVLMYIYVPVFVRLRLTSAYEYFEWRFSRRVRVLLSVFALIHLIFYMPTTVYGPSLALDQVAGINAYLSCAAIFIVCIAYSSLGGLKAVLWSDALQAAVMFISLFSIIIAGVDKIGGVSLIWERALQADRLNFFIMDPDPRTRHTFWTCLVGGFFLWLPLFGATQSQIQRYNSVPNLRTSRITLFFNMIGLAAIVFLCVWIGLMIFAKYFDCDPVKTEIIKSPDQLLPLFVMEVLGDIPGLPGLLVAGLTCGSLSSVSSALNSLTAIITIDFVKYYMPNLTEERLALVSKIISTLSGMVAFSLVFIVAEINKTVQVAPFSTLMHGSMLGPIIGAFSLGMFFPWANELGTLIAIVLSVILSAFVSLGNIIAGRADKLPNQKLSLITDGCRIQNSTSNFLSFSNKESVTFSNNWKEEHKDDSFAIKIWSLSYIWQPGLGGLSTFLLGIIFSALILVVQQNKQIKRVNESLLSKPFVRLWRKCFGESYVQKWIDFDSKPFVSGEKIDNNLNIIELNRL